jgi:type IV pilus assembly protein PilM
MASQNLVGLDIGSMSVRAVETTRGRDAIARFGIAPLPKGTVQSGVVHNDAAVTAAVKQLWATMKFKTRSVVLGVTNPQVVVREMSVANLPPRELKQALPFQVRDSLPLPVERSLLDFYPLENPGTNENVRGLLIAAPKEAVLTAVQAVEKAGIHVERVDLASFALLRAASRLDNQVEAIVDIGAQVTTVVVHQDGVPLIVRTIPRGGAEITEQVASRLKVDNAIAEDLKCRIGMAGPGDHAAGRMTAPTLETDEEAGGRRAEATVPDPSGHSETVAVIKDAVRPLVNEIRSSFAYLNTGERQARVARLVLSGGGAMLAGLPELLSSQLSIAVEVADPTVRIRGSKRGQPEAFEQFRTSATVSVGLTLGAA